MVRGPMSALAPISLNADQRFAAAVPNEAELFSFAHPADYVWLEPDEESGAFGEKIDKSRWLPLEKNLEKLDLTKELGGLLPARRRLLLLRQGPQAAAGRQLYERADARAI